MFWAALVSIYQSYSECRKLLNNRWRVSRKVWSGSSSFIRNFKTNQSHCCNYRWTIEEWICSPQRNFDFAKTSPVLDPFQKTTTVLRWRCWHAAVMRLHLSLLCATFCLFSTAVDSHLPSSPVAHADHLLSSLSCFLTRRSRRSAFISPPLPYGSGDRGGTRRRVGSAGFGLNKKKYLTLGSFVVSRSAAVSSLAVKQEKKVKKSRH